MARRYGADAATSRNLFGWARSATRRGSPGTGPAHAASASHQSAGSSGRDAARGGTTESGSPSANVAE